MAPRAAIRGRAAMPKFNTKAEFNTKSRVLQRHYSVAAVRRTSSKGVLVAAQAPEADLILSVKDHLRQAIGKFKNHQEREEKKKQKEEEKKQQDDDNEVEDEEEENMWSNDENVVSDSESD
ncbi:PR domain zinc finger protein 2-like [Frankliniella occidentalis]|uniref:PR domain zinc finger protein 2-like n=1 Tax=Frankliniella occidentalis TaxID=133901 RepID=A0A9C6UF98_FRAOC|nr:PR domain zinc finger protein 2-like [Frankliniella occidentalis]